LSRKYYYIGLLVLLIVIFVGVDAMRSNTVHWMKTYNSEHTFPFGSNAFLQLSEGMFPDVTTYRIPFNEVFESLEGTSYNGLAFAEGLSFTTIDTREILKAVEDGSTFFFASDYSKGTLLDTLNITVDYSFISNENGNIGLDFKNFFNSTNRTVRLLNKQFEDYPKFRFNKEGLYYISSFDSLNTSILAVNEENHAVAIKVNYGDGFIIYTTIPEIFTNIYLLHSENILFTEALLSYLPDNDLHWSEYYQLGRAEERTSLRYILSQEPLRWAYYCLMILLALFVIFEIKRKQKAIRIVTPLPNTSLQFITTIGNLYFEKKDNQDIALKRMNFFLDQIRTNYYLKTTSLDEEFTKKLSTKSGEDIKEIEKLVKFFNWAKVQNQISDESLSKLNLLIENFTSKHLKK